jgi:fucose permease
MPVFLPILRRSAQGAAVLSNEQLGRISATAFAGVVSGLLVSGPLANRFQAKWFTVGGNLLIACGLVALGLSGSYRNILAGVALMGIGGGILDMILSPIVCALRPDHKAQAMNWLHSFYCIGAVLTVLAATIAFERSFSWQEVALWMSVPPFILGVTFLFLRHPLLVSEETKLARVRDLLPQRFFLLASGAIFLAGAAEMGVAQWLPAYAELELGMSRAVGGASLLSFSVAMALGRIGIGALSGRVSMFRLMAWGSGSTAFLLLLAGLFPDARVSLAACIASGFAVSCLWPGILASAADQFPSAGASMFGALSAFGNFGGILMPWAIGAIADRGDIALGIAASAVCPLLVLAAVKAMRVSNGVRAGRSAA